MVMTEWPHFVLDTNVVLYLLGNRVAEPLPSGSYVLSIISEMELLSYPNLSETEEQQIRNFLGQLQIIGLFHRVKTTAIDLRKQHGIKLRTYAKPVLNWGNEIYKIRLLPILAE